MIRVLSPGPEIARAEKFTNRLEGIVPLPAMTMLTVVLLVPEAFVAVTVTA
jgi:hypothetical protein